jgi:hypothetical protein
MFSMLAQTRRWRVKFVHRFDRSTTCSLFVSDTAPAPGEPHVLSVEWTGTRKAKHTNAYRAWIVSTHEFLANRWQRTILYALGVAPNLTELWLFEPERTPKLIEKLRSGIFSN